MTKVAVAACGIVLVLLVVGILIVIQFEISLLDTFNAEYRDKTNASITANARELTDTLRQNVTFNAAIFAETVAIHLYNYDAEELQKSLVPFMNYPQIVVVNVLDEENEVFSTAWKDPEIRVGEALPEAISVEALLLVEVDSIRDDARLGRLQVFYTDAILHEKIEQTRQAAMTQVADFHDRSNVRLQRAILKQNLGIGGILLVLMLCLVFLLHLLVRTPLLKLSTVTHRLREFDLTVDVPAHNQDEAGRLLAAIKQLVDSFRDVVSQVQHSGIHVTSSATELSATAKQQEVIVTKQVDAVHAVVGSVQSIADISAQLLQTMNHVAAMSQEATVLVGSGQNDLGRMEEAMRQMEHASRTISGRLETINEKAENITNVVTTITKVADQTNLLSLNAAIEAEKAGEYGRGFTVVAVEIRRLADQTAVATLDIEQMVKDMQAAVSAGVMEMDKFVTEVRHSAEDVNSVGIQLAHIIEHVQALSPNFDQVNAGMEHQSESVGEITRAMQDIQQDMQTSKTSLHETYSAIEQLNEAARALHTKISRFTV